MEIIEKRIVTAMYTKKVNDCNNDELVDVVSPALASAYFTAIGSSPQPNDLAVITVTVVNQLKQNYGGLNIGEFPILLEMGVFSFFGDYKFLNAPLFCNWVKSYMSSDIRVRAIKKFNIDCKQLESKEKGQENLKSEIYINRIYENFCKTGYIGFTYISIYQYLQRRGIIKNTLEEKCEAMVSAQKRCKTVSEAKGYAQKKLLEEFFEKNKKENKKTIF